MNDWIELINSIKNNSFVKEKYEQMNRVNQSSILTSNEKVNPESNNQNQK